ncbi:MAG: putative immunity protein [Candidatus Saccharimonadales bacterium]
MRERSPQTLSEADRRLVASWAADCVERVIKLFEAEAPNDNRPRALVARTRSFARGELDTAEEIRRRFSGGVSASELKSPVAKAVARACGQAVAVSHLGAHGLSAAACAVNAVRLAYPDEPDAADNEVRWQLEHMSAEVRKALQSIPPVDEITSGVLGPGLNTSGHLGKIVRALQVGIYQTK